MTQAFAYISGLLRQRNLPLLVILLSGCLISCDDDFVDPFENDARYYTVFGYLDALELDHAVRVIPVTRHPELIRAPHDPQGIIDAEVFSIELSSGYTVEWTPSLEQLDDGNYGHVYRAQFIVRPNNTYRLEVRRSDGIVTSAETYVPSIPEAERLQLSVPKVQDNTSVTQDIVIPGVPSPWEIQAVYLVESKSVQQRFYIPYDRAGAPTPDGSWQLTLNLSVDQQVVRQKIQTSIEQGILANDPIQLTMAGLQIRMLDPNWRPPEGEIDEVALSQPAAFSNVRNGYGFWGSIGYYSQEWPIEPDFSKILGY